MAEEQSRSLRGLQALAVPLAAWFAYLYFIAVPGEVRETEQLVRAECLAAGRDNTYCTCVSGAFSAEASDARINLSIRRGTFVTYQSYVDELFPRLLAAAITRCEA